MRLIDANVLKEKILKERDAIPKTVTERYCFGVEFPNHFGDAIRGGIRKALRCMEQCPTIDAVPVVHGRWECEYETWGRLQCSICKKEALLEKSNGDVGRILLYVTSNYCPHCGAKMEGDDT